VLGASAGFATLSAAALAVIAISIVAAGIPVWRATQVDAVEKLHRA
jgi:ABC-type antimicrobial peptide transport system permease subunit